MSKFNDFNILNKNSNISNNSSAVNKENKSHNLEFDENLINKLFSQLNEKDQTISLLQNEIIQLKKNNNNPFGDFSMIGGGGEQFNENFIEEDINFLKQINKSQNDINKLKIDNNNLNQSAGKLPSEIKDNNENKNKNNNKDDKNIKENNNNNLNNNNSKNIKIGSNILLGNVDNEEFYNEQEEEKQADQQQIDLLKTFIREEKKKNQKLLEKIDNIKNQIVDLFKHIKYSKKIEFFIKQICQLLEINASTFFKQIK